MEKALYSVREFAELTGYSIGHVRRLCETGRLSHSRPNGGKIFIPAEDARSYIYKARIASLTDNQ